jgi:hypothetical protein
LNNLQSNLYFNAFVPRAMLKAEKIVDFQDRKAFQSGGGGGKGPEDPMFEARLKSLESRSERLEAGFQRLEVGFARIEERFASIATKDDVSRLETRLVSEISEVRGRVANLPTTWQIVGILAALLFGMASLVYATTTFLAQKSPLPSAQTQVK